MPKLVRKKIAPRKKITDVAQQKGQHKPDIVLLVLVVALTLFGLLMIANVSAYKAFHEDVGKYFYAKQQLLWIFISSIVGIFAYKISYKSLYKLSPILLIGTLILLVLVLVPGVADVRNGAKRWIDLSKFIPGLPSFSIQPAELVKPALVIYLAAWLCKLKQQFSIRTLVTFGMLTGFVLGLVMLEPDLGTTTIIILSVAGLYFASGAPIYQFLLIAPVGLIIFIALIVFEPYRLQRLTAFLHPNADPQGVSYHISQILITLGSGGLTGLGFGNSAQTYGYLPEPMTDSIFAVIAGEIGFIGSLILLVMYLLVISRALQITRKTQDKYGQLLAVGLTLWLSLQVITNIGSMVALFPLTGVPLPFISYGGSSLVTSIFAVGLLLNISRFTTEKQKV